LIKSINEQNTKTKQKLKDTRYNSSKNKKEFVILYKYNVGYMVQAYRKGNNENKKQSIVKTRDPESNASPL
jgi:hypothetical protein